MHTATAPMCLAQNMSINNKLYVRSEYIANKNINSPSEIKVLLLNFSMALPVTPQSYRTLLGFLHLLDGVKGGNFLLIRRKHPYPHVD